MNLSEHLAVHTPLVWVTSDESRRVVLACLQYASDRRVYRMDAIDGFVGYDPDTKVWKKILVDTEEGPEPTTDLSDALLYALENKGIMIVEHAHTVADKIIPFLDYVNQQYVNAFYADNLNSIPPSLILVSCKDEIPPELTRAFVRQKFELPGEADLKDILGHISTRLHTSKREIAAEVRAGLGMSEFEFTQACAVSLKKFNRVDPEFVNGIKMHNLKAEGILEIRQPKITLDDVGGLDNAKDLITRVTWLWSHPNEAQKFGMEPLRRVLLIGVSGAGKSFLCEATARSLGLDLAQFGVSRMMNKFVGESENNMRRAFTQIKAMKPIVLWIDELGRDLSGGQSSGQVDGGTTDRVHGEFLQGLQELPNEVFLMCAANRIDGLPPEMLRADRFDKIMFVGFPTPAERIEIWRIHLGEHSQEYDLEALANATPQFTGAEIKHLIKDTRFNIVGDYHRKPKTGEFVVAAQSLKGRVWVNHHDHILKMYQRALKEWDWASSGQEAEAPRLLAGAAQAKSAAPQKRSDLGSHVQKASGH